MKVLVAEDDLMSLRLLDATFSRWGYEVDTCSDGLQAWERLRSEDPPEIAVLDWMMPGLDGPELCRRVRQSPELAAIYIILVTVKSRGADMIEGLEAGADDFISKPFDRGELAARVRVGERLLETQKQRLKLEGRAYGDRLEQAVFELMGSKDRDKG